MKEEKKENKLEWTGERYLPQLSGDIQLEHYHRYLLASKFAAGKKVLDIACGEGYGSNLIADVAASVIGVDISRKTIKHAKTHYHKPNLKFMQGSCADIPLKKNSVDLVVSFETIEHHDQHEEMMREIRRVLKSDGILIISSPDKKEYSDIPNYTNPFHVKELYLSEFDNLLKRKFKNVTMLGQRVKFGSLIAPTDRRRMARFLPFDKEKYNTEEFRPLYFIAIASNRKISDKAISFYSSPFEEAEFVQAFHSKLEQQHNYQH